MISKKQESTEKTLLICFRKKIFPAIYSENGSIDYSDACDCESDFHPVSGQPSISEWLENRKEQ